MSRALVGFDRLHAMIETAIDAVPAHAYPPVNVEKRGESDFRVTLAIAGFTADEVSIEVRDGRLEIEGGKARPDKDEGRIFLHRGIAARSFKRGFQLADHMEVKAATLRDGLLCIDLVREVPEAMKPRKIDIGA
jgi:molecular chaperone IbpA